MMGAADNELGPFPRELFKLALLEYFFSLGQVKFLKGNFFVHVTIK